MSDVKKQFSQGKNAYNFSVHNVFIKDLSFEAPNTPRIFSLDWNPKVEFNLEMGANQISKGLWESMLDVTVTVNLNIDKNKREAHGGKEVETAFIAEVKQAGVFSVDGFTEDQTDRILSMTVPSILFPYIREVVSNLVSRGGFPQFILPPMNFESMYEQRKSNSNKTNALPKGNVTL